MTKRAFLVIHMLLVVSHQQSVFLLSMNYTQDTQTSMTPQSSEGRCVEDVPKKQSSRSKENAKLIEKGKARSTCLSKRRTTMFKKGSLLSKKTGVDVLVVISSERDIRFFGTGQLKEDFVTGKLQIKDCKETSEDSLRGNGVLPLTETPSPVNNEPTCSKIRGILKSSTRRSLNATMNTSSIASQVPERVLEVLTNKAVPVLLQTEKN